jgi:hypothetical protein
MAGGVTDTDRGFAELAEQLRQLAGEQVSVLVGVNGDTDSDMVVIAAANEYGTDDGHVPERSYLRDTVDNGAEQVLDDLQQAVQATLGGADLDAELGKVGEAWVGKIKTAIRDKSDPPNADSTVEAKGTDNPLIDQGRLRNSISWTLHRGDTQPLGGA